MRRSKESGWLTQWLGLNSAGGLNSMPSLKSNLQSGRVMTDRENIWPLEEAEIVRLLSTHYQLQSGALITDRAQDGPWIDASSNISSAPMWNHIAWIGPGTPADALAQAQSRWANRPAAQPFTSWTGTICRRAQKSRQERIRTL